MTPVFVQVNTASIRGRSNPIGYLIEESGCWIWVGGKNRMGYGTLKVNGRSTLAHRWVFERDRGAIPPGLTLDHLCRNHDCVNPDHLDPVSHRENVLRGEGFAAKYARQTHCLRGHLLEGDNLRAYALRGGWRECRTCQNAHNRAYRARQREARAA